jgi:hypothetical protein
MLGSGCDKSVIYKEVFFGSKSYQLKKTDISQSVSNLSAVDSFHGSDRVVLM